MTVAETDPWLDVAAARLPLAHLDALAGVRDRADVRILVEDDRVWVKWAASRGDVLRGLVAVPGVQFLTTRDGEWFPFNRRIPVAEGPPLGEWDAVSRHLHPQSLAWKRPDDDPLPGVALRIVRGEGPRPTTALACDLTTLAGWADAATTLELSRVSASRSGGRVLLRGERLPAIASAVRYWGDNVLIPLGFVAEPDLPASVIREAVGAAEIEIVVIDESGIEIVPADAFAPLTRAAVRAGATS